MRVTCVCVHDIQRAVDVGGKGHSNELTHIFVCYSWLYMQMFSSSSIPIRFLNTFQFIIRHQWSPKSECIIGETETVLYGSGWQNGRCMSANTLRRHYCLLLSYACFSLSLFTTRLLASANIFFCSCVSLYVCLHETPLTFCWYWRGRVFKIICM